MRCMITIHFHLQQLTAQQQTEMAALIPREQAHIKELREKGLVEAIYISTDRSSVWVVMRGESLEQIQDELKSFPLYPYMEPTFTSLLD